MYFRYQRVETTFSLCLVEMNVNCGLKNSKKESCHLNKLLLPIPWKTK